MLFRKKPKVDIRLLTADMIELAIARGIYYNTQMGHRYMCITLYELVARGYITTAERHRISDVILGMIGGRSTLNSHLNDQGIEVVDMDEFEHRITLSNWWWRAIRRLRNQPTLVVNHD